MYCLVLGRIPPGKRKGKFENMQTDRKGTSSF